MPIFSKKLMAEKITSVKSNRGVSIIAAIVTILILSIMGVTLVSTVIMDQESRSLQLMQDQSFYSAQAALEYGLGEVEHGGYPIVVNKALNSVMDGFMTVSINASTHRMSVTGSSGSAQTSYSIRVYPLAGDCVSMNSASANLIGSWAQLTGVSSSKNCLSAATIDKMVLTWTPNSGEKVVEAKIDGVTFFSDPAGYSSGVTIDGTDYTISDSSSHSHTFIFSDPMYQMGNPPISLKVDLIFTDSSQVSSTFNLVVYFGSG